MLKLLIVENLSNVPFLLQRVLNDYCNQRYQGFNIIYENLKLLINMKR